MEKGLNKYLKGDMVLWAIFFGLTMLSFVAVSSAGSALAVKNGSADVSSVLFKHIKFAIMGFVVLFVTYRLPMKFFLGFSKILLPVAIGLLILTVTFGTSINGAKRWLVLPLVGQIQTSEIAKAALILFLARVATIYHNNKPEFEKQVKHVHWIMLFSVGLIFMHDFSTAFLIYVIMIIMMFVLQVDRKLLGKFIGIAAGLGVFYSLMAEAIGLPGRVSTLISRLRIFLNPELDPLKSIQPDIAQISVMDGALSPMGPGKNFVKYALPESQSDYIYAFIIGEWSLLMGIIIMGAYVAILYRGIQIARKAKTVFPAYLAMGFTIMLTVQAFMHMAVAVGLGPVTGQPLPFVSMGGTSYLISSFAMGLILNASVSVDKQAKQIVKKVDSAG